MNKIFSERTVLLLVLVMVIAGVLCFEFVGIELSEFTKFITTAIVSFFFGQSMPSSAKDNFIG